MLQWAAAMYEWARSDLRISGLAPWHWPSMAWLKFSPGLPDLAPLLRVYKEIGREILSGRQGNIDWSKFSHVGEPGVKVDDDEAQAVAGAINREASPLSWSGAELALPSPQQLDFQTHHPIGCFFHFGVNTFAGAEHGSLREVPSMFDAPIDLDTDQWAEACVQLGGSYAVFTAKHEEGLMNWPSKSSTYTIERSPFCAARKKVGRSCDIVAEFLASCVKYRLSRGIYYTLVNAQCQRSASGWTPGMAVNNTNCTLPLVMPDEVAARADGPLEAELLQPHAPQCLHRARDQLRADRAVLVRPRQRALRGPRRQAPARRLGARARFHQ